MSDDSFLSRWSRRKLEGAPEEPVAPEPAPEPDVEKTDEEILEELGLPDPEALEPGDDFSAFMAKAVPERLRNRALRKLWLSNPVLANLDELVDYGDDFTDAATVIENLQTVYQVGKGMLVEEEAEPEEEDAPEDVALADAAEPAPELPEEPPESPLPELAADEPPEMPLPRRMRFTFEQT